jgi:hypothetical protein
MMTGTGGRLCAMSNSFMLSAARSYGRGAEGWDGSIQSFAEAQRGGSHDDHAEYRQGD